jgi:hypothetical protein
MCVAQDQDNKLNKDPQQVFYNEPHAHIRLAMHDLMVNGIPIYNYASFTKL